MAGQDSILPPALCQLSEPGWLAPGPQHDPPGLAWPSGWRSSRGSPLLGGATGASTWGSEKGSEGQGGDSGWLWTVFNYLLILEHMSFHILLFNIPFINHLCP